MSTHGHRWPHEPCHRLSSKAHPDLKAPKDHLVPKDHPDLLASANPVHKVYVATLAPLVPKATLVHKAQSALKAPKAILVSPALKASQAKAGKLTMKPSITFALTFFMSLIAMAAYAVTTDEIWRAVYDSANTALRINIVAS